MGVTIAAADRYAGAIRDLFPKGEYWEKQFADSVSDLNLFCKAKTDEIARLRMRIRDLLLESDYQTAVETLDDWERVLLGHTNTQLSLEQRRKILDTRNSAVLNRVVISNIADKYGLSLTDITFPFKPSFFGFSQFGVSVFSRSAFFSVFFIVSKFKDEELKTEAKNRITKLLDNTSFGRGCFGAGQFLNRFYFITDSETRIFAGIKTLDDFERDVNGKLPAGSIAYFLYKL